LADIKIQDTNKDTILEEFNSELPKQIKDLRRFKKKDPFPGKTNLKRPAQLIEK